MIYLKIVKQYKHVRNYMAINDCPETASETCFQEKKLVYAYFKIKKFQKKNISLKFDNLAYSTNHAKS